MSPTPPIDRFLAKVEKTETCWLWKGATGAREGYGMFWLHGRMIHAHRAAYELFVAPIPAGHDIDHLCRVRACARPDHLEAVTRAVNVLRGNGAPAQHARQTTCARGHAFRQYGRRRDCRTCATERSRAYRARRAAA